MCITTTPMSAEELTNALTTYGINNKLGACHRQRIKRFADLVKWCKHTHRAIFGKPRKEVKQTILSVDAVSEQSICKVNTPVSKPATLEDRMTIMEGKVDRVVKQVDTLQTLTSEIVFYVGYVITVVFNF